MRWLCYGWASFLALGLMSEGLAGDKPRPEAAHAKRVLATPSSSEAGREQTPSPSQQQAQQNRGARAEVASVSGRDAGLRAAPPAGEARIEARQELIRVPPIKMIRNLSQAYHSGAGPHILILLHVPKDKGGAFVEVYNRTSVEISLFRFTLTALGHEGELEFEGLPAGWSAVKQVKFDSIRELAIRNPRAIDKDANDITPRLEIHQTQMLVSNMTTGMRKVDL